MHAVLQTPDRVGKFPTLPNILTNYEMWGQGLTVDCSMDFVNLSSFFETLNAKLLSVAEEFHPSVGSGKFIPVETYILEIHPSCETSDWVASIPVSTVAKGHRQ